ncbi:MAG: SH3 domain-containing protein, partial [Lentisphaeria bacterium]|nr:SH3 domain-containing protein [Lentisphaeria bacterium]
KFLFVLWFLLLPLALAADPVIGTVTANRLNVRPKPGTNYHVLCELERGAFVTVVRELDDWYGILCPTEASAWIPAARLDGNGVTTAATRVYAGPGTLYASYDNLPAATQVAVVESRDKWRRIEPPSDSVAWVHRNYVALPEPEPEPEPTVVEIRPLPAPEDVTIHRIQPKPQDGPLTYFGDAKKVSKSGVIVPLGTEESAWAHALAVHLNDTYYPLSYLKAEDIDFKKWEWRPVTIGGTQHWVKGWPRPLIEVDEIEDVR